MTNADKQARMQRNAVILCKMLLTVVSRGGSDFSGWHGATAAEIGGMLADARYILNVAATEPDGED